MFGSSNAGRKRGNPNYKTIIRIERAIRLEVKGFSDDQISQHIGLSKAGLATLKRNPLYTQVRIRVLNNVVGDLEQELGDDTHYIHSKIRSMLPKALQVLEDALENSDVKARLSAAADVFDRDGKLAKVSRIGLPSNEQGGFSPKIDTTIVDGLVAAIGALKDAGKNPDSASN
jgi:DNA-binding phage protein